MEEKKKKRTQPSPLRTPNGKRHHPRGIARQSTHTTASFFPSHRLRQPRAPHALSSSGGAVMVMSSSWAGGWFRPIKAHTTRFRTPTRFRFAALPLQLHSAALSSSMGLRVRPPARAAATSFSRSWVFGGGRLAGMVGTRVGCYRPPERVWVLIVWVLRFFGK